jgi:hypothetical protein
MNRVSELIEKILHEDDVAVRHRVGLSGRFGRPHSPAALRKHDEAFAVRGEIAQTAVRHHRLGRVPDAVKGQHERQPFAIRTWSAHESRPDSRRCIHADRGNDGVVLSPLTGP